MAGRHWTNEEQARLIKAAELYENQWVLIARFDNLDRPTKALSQKYRSLDNDGWEPPDDLDPDPLRIETSPGSVAQDIRRYISSSDTRSHLPKHLKEYENNPPPSRPSPEDVERHLSGEAVPGVTDEPPTVIKDWVDEDQYHDPERVWERSKKKNARAIEYHDKRHKARVQIATHRPVALTFISDQHISEGTPTDMERMEADAQLVQETPGMYAILGGDGTDNHIKHRTAIIASGSKPGDEYRMYDHYLGIFGHSLIAMISGNHDDWTKDFTDLDVVGMLAKRRRIFYAPDYVVLTVQLGAAESNEFQPSQEYTVKIRHQYRYNSSFNQTHSVKRMWEMDDDDFDIGVVCHKHEAAMEPFTKHGVWRVAFRPGSYQIQSGFSRRYGYKKSKPACPTAVVLPDRREMVPFIDVRQAASYLTWLRKAWPDVGEVFGEAA